MQSTGLVSRFSSWVGRRPMRNSLRLPHFLPAHHRPADLVVIHDNPSANINDIEKGARHKSEYLCDCFFGVNILAYIYLRTEQNIL
jgi:hypothetical protein